MKVLFICSQNNQRYDVAPFIKAQGDSLAKEGIDLEYFLVKGKGLTNYLKNIPRLQAYLQENSVDVIHAHYSLCGMVAVLATRKIPVVVSFMGDDVLGTPDQNGRLTFKSRLILLIAKLIQPFSKALIAKSPNIYRTIYRQSIAHLIPNGVQLDKFQEDIPDAAQQLGLNPNKEYILFLAKPDDPNKNVTLVKEAIHFLDHAKAELLVVSKAPHDQVQLYLHAASVVVLSSYSEGSPNVIKEAMACNRPIVSTKVGDVAMVIGETQGCYLANHNPKDFAEQLNKALKFAKAQGKTQGRKSLLDQGLDSVTIARKLTGIYNKLVVRKETTIELI